MNEHSTQIAVGTAGFESICACGWRSFTLPTRQEAAELASAHEQRIVTLPPHLEAIQAAEYEINRKLAPITRRAIGDPRGKTEDWTVEDWNKRMDTWLGKIEALAPGDACEFHYPARSQWLPGTVVVNGGSGYWSIRDDSDVEGWRGRVSDSLYIEQVRLPGQMEAWPR